MRLREEFTIGVIAWYEAHVGLAMDAFNAPELAAHNGSDLPMVESFFQPLKGKSSSPAVHEDALTSVVNTGSSLVVFKEKQLKERTPRHARPRPHARQASRELLHLAHPLVQVDLLASLGVHVQDVRA